MLTLIAIYNDQKSILAYLPVTQYILLLENIFFKKINSRKINFKKVNYFPVFKNIIKNKLKNIF
jgi:hypothetical protein